MEKQNAIKSGIILTSYIQIRNPEQLHHMTPIAYAAALKELGMQINQNYF